MRPATFKVDGTVYWAIRTYTDAGVLVDADSNPTVAVRKNGSATADSVTVTKRAATTGIYDCSWNPAGEVEGDLFFIEETATVSSQAYENAWSIEALAAERGTDSALLASDKPTNFDLLAINGSGEVTTANPASGGGSAHTPADVVAAMQAVSGDFKADVSGLATQTSVDVIDGIVDAILVDTNELQLNQGNWNTATGFSTHSASDVVTAMQAVANDFKADVSALASQSSIDVIDGIVDAILLDTADLQANQGAWATATGFSTHSASDVVTAMQAVSGDFKADVSGLASQTSVDSIDADVQAIGSDVSTILTDTNELQLNQGNWVTATGFSTHSAADVVTGMQAVSGDFKADVSGLASQASVNVIDGIVDAILVDTADLQANQGNWLTATGFSTFDPATDTVTTDTASRDASKADVSGLLTASAYTASLPANFADLAIEVSTGKVTTANPAAGSGSAHTAADVVAAMQAVSNDFKADVSGLSTQASVDVIDGIVDAILVDTNELQTNQGDWATATGFSTFDPANDTVANVTTVQTTVNNSDMRGTDGANTVAPVDVSANVAAILADTNELQSNQGNWLTATGFSTFNHATDEVITDAASRNASKADVSGLSTFDASVDQVVASNMRGTDNAILASSAPANWSNLIVGTGADLGKVTTSNPAAGSGSAHTAQDVANLILVTPANKLATDVSGNVEANNMRGTDGANTVAPDNAGITSISNAVSALNDISASDVWNSQHGAGYAAGSFGEDLILAFNSNRTVQITGSNHVAADIHEVQTNAITAVGLDSGAVSKIQNGLATQSSLNTVDANVDSILLDTNELQQNQGDWATATGFATPANVLASQGVVTTAISNLNDFNPATDVVANVTLVDTTTNLTNGGGGGGGNCPTAQEIVDAWGNQDQSVYVTQGTLGYNLDAQVSSAGSGGSGLYQSTVRVQDISGNALQGARVNVDGTTLTLVTGSNGEVTFNLDSGVYLFNVSPPANYDTPTGQVLTVTSSDPADTIFSLTETTPSAGCDIAWL